MTSDLQSTLLALSVADLDGRERGARRFRDGIGAIEADLDAPPGPLARMLAVRAVALATLADRLDVAIAEGRGVNIGDYVALSNALATTVAAFRSEADRDRDRERAGAAGRAARKAVA